MANTLYNIAREKFLTGNMDWSSDTFKVALVHVATGAYTFSATHTSLGNIGANTINGSGGAQTLISKTFADGAAGAANATFTSVPVGSTIEAIVIYRDEGATTTLVAYIDTATGLPITPNGGDIIVTWDTGVNKIFRL